MSFQTYLLSTTIDLSTHSVDSKCVKNSQTHKNVKSHGKTGNHSSSSSTKWKKEKVPGSPGICLSGPLSFLVAITFFCYANDEYMKGPGSQWSSQHGHLEFYSRYPPFLSRVPPPHRTSAQLYCTKKSHSQDFGSVSCATNLPLHRVLGQWEKVG